MMTNRPISLIILLMSLAFVVMPGKTIQSGNPPDEGMWLPILLERLNYVDMQKMGLHLTPEELYSINTSSLKDAIVGLSGGSPANSGFFCTAEVVSGNGLIFTNHHCGYSAVQNLSTPEHDYLTDGFWARSHEEELYCKGINASFLVRIENVTDSIIPFLSDTLSESDRGKKVREISKRLNHTASEDGKYECKVSSFYSGNEYYLFVFKTYKDVRLVGAPPSSIGKFGGDTDNWMWPRHTGDFTIFRIYADGENAPADHTEENVPLKPDYHLPISLGGVKKHDFAMIWGYPGGTSRYLTSYGIEYNLNAFYPVIIDVFGKQMEVMKERMNVDTEARIAYSDDYAGLSNTWKNFIGQTKMLKKNKVIQKKEATEKAFTEWINANTMRTEKYSNVLPSLK
ncbi:MAG: S46 family peptidase, partial [Bacteroidales bacterium]|nr:S46 family peptidase [Bacteroidales bacterium]